MSTRPSTGRRPRKDGHEVDMFDHRRQFRHRRGASKEAKTAVNRRERRSGRQQGWNQG